MTYRRLVFVTLVVVVAGLVYIPVRTLVNHYHAVTSMADRPSDFQLEITEPYYGKELKRVWYTRLLGTVGQVLVVKHTLTAEDALALRKLRGLTELLVDTPTDEAWTCLPPQLTKFGVRQRYDGRLSLQALPHIAKLRRLNSLQIIADLTDSEVEQISRISNIESLDLQYNDRLTDGCLRHVAKMPSLRVLKISESPVRLSNKGLPLPRNLSGVGLAKLHELRPDISINPWP